MLFLQIDERFLADHSPVGNDAELADGEAFS